jgi:N-acetylmuramoyl-L-alanine amidase
VKLAGSIAGAALAGMVLISPVCAQSVPPLTYEQPLPPNAVQRVQERLRAAGVYNGAVDGVWGPDSVAALQRYQAVHQLQATGQLNQATAAALGLDPAVLLAPQSTAAAAVPPPETLRPSSVRAIQSRLRALGFYNGAVDGAWGSGTQRAIERFQQSRGLQPNGQLNPPTVNALGLGEGLVYR